MITIHTFFFLYRFEVGKSKNLSFGVLMKKEKNVDSRSEILRV